MFRSTRRIPERWSPLKHIGKLALVALALLCFLATPVTAERTGSGTAADPYVDTYSAYRTTEHVYTQNLTYYSYQNAPTISPTSFRNYPVEAADPVSMMIFTSYNLTTASGTFTFNGTTGTGRWASTTLDDPEHPGYPGFLILRFDNGTYTGEPLTINGTWPITGYPGYLSCERQSSGPGAYRIVITQASFGFAAYVFPWRWHDYDYDYDYIHNGGYMGVRGNYIYSIAISATDTLTVYCYEDAGFRKTEVFNPDTPADIYVYYDDILINSTINDPGTSGTPFYAEYLADFRPGAPTHVNTLLRRPQEWINYTYTFPTPPGASFVAAPTSGMAPLTVQFTDTSTGDPTVWAWEFGDGWGSNARNPAHTYASPGTYTVILTAYNAVGSDVRTRYNYITVTAPEPTGSAIVNGYVYDITNDILVDGATITVRNDTYSTTATSSGGGYYQVSGLAPGTYTVKGAKAGYVASPDYAVSLADGAVVRQDIALGVSGVAIVGTVYDASTGAPLDGVTVTAAQGSGNFTTITSGGGKYTLNNLSTGIETTITATFAGYIHNPVVLTQTSSTPYTVDLYLLPTAVAHNGTALAGLVTDAATHQAIANAQVHLPSHANVTTSPTGFYLFDDLSAGTYYVSASASGYKDSSPYAVTLTEGNLTMQDISLTSATATATNMDYPPHLVRILCVDEYNRPLQNVTIQAVYQESSSPVDWLAEWLGIAPNVQVTTETLEGTTGLDGSVVFLMVQSVQYRFTVAAPALNMTKTFDLYPKEDQITIRFQTSTRPDLSTMPTYDLTATEINSSAVRLALSYHDTTNATTALTFIVTDHATGELIHTETFDSSDFPGTVSPTYDVSNTKGATYRFGFEAENSVFGDISSYKGITLKGDGLLVDLGFEDRTLYNWIAVILLFLFAGAFSGTNVKQGAILVPLFGGGLFWFIGWLPITIGGAISAIGFLGVLVYMRKNEWKVRA
ncbi:MAG: hypothetical protein PWR16_2293 [Methanoculleus sp.]|nr:hypothetical protein [Methanoculleus sp.]